MTSKTLQARTERFPYKRSRLGGIGVRAPLVLPGERIGLMGGSFNPPHEGHAIVARTAQRRLGLARVWWLVTPGNPLKSKSIMPPTGARIRLVQALMPERSMVATDFEVRLATSYTVETLRFLRRRYPATRFVWIMGADSLANFHKWRDWRGIARAMPIAVVDRPGWRLKAVSSPAAQALGRFRWPEAEAALLATRRPPAWTILTARLSETSSTRLRERAPAH